MAKKKYSELLKDPRWQKLRLKILERDNWECRSCGETEKTLHVHHNYYEKGRSPWEYHIDSLIALCVDCHEKESNRRHEREQELILIMKEIGFLCLDIEEISHSFCFTNRINIIQYCMGLRIEEVTKTVIEYIDRCEGGEDEEIELKIVKIE